MLTRNLRETIAAGQDADGDRKPRSRHDEGRCRSSRARLALANSNLGRNRSAHRLQSGNRLIVGGRRRWRCPQPHRHQHADGGVSDRRNVAPDQTVNANAEPFRIANLSIVSLSLKLQPADAGRVKPGNSFTVTAAGRQATAPVRFVSPVLDEQARVYRRADGAGGRGADAVPAAYPLCPLWRTTNERRANAGYGGLNVVQAEGAVTLRSLK